MILLGINLRDLRSRLENKVKVGDFTSRHDADDLKFMLNQLGYKEARIVQETVNIFE